jgi:hypothetical protein
MFYWIPVDKPDSFPIGEYMRHGLILYLLFCSTLCGGCATIMRGTHEQFDLVTSPPDATVAIGGKTYQTPAHVDLTRKQTYPVMISKEGYRTLHFNLTPEWDGVSLVGNLIIPGGSAGLVCDRLDGADMAFYKLAKIKLQPATRPDEPPMLLTPFQGMLLDNVQYAQAVDFDRKDRSRFFRGEP